MFEWLLSPEALVALFTLTALEIVLGIDNIILISILVASQTTTTGTYYRLKPCHGNPNFTPIDPFLDDAINGAVVRFIW